jgi:hypothetical protein
MVSPPGAEKFSLIVVTRLRARRLCAESIPRVFPSYSLVAVALCIEGLPRVCLS